MGTEAFAPEKSMMRMRRAVLVFWGLTISLLLTAPAFVVIALSFTGKRSLKFPPDKWSLRWYREFFDNSEWGRSLAISLELALAVTVLATVMGVSLAFALDRKFIGRAFLWVIVLAPLAIPLIASAVGIYAVYIEWGLAGTFLGLMLSHTCLAIPLVTVTVFSGLVGLDRQILLAATSLGATPWRVFRQVTLPILLPSVAGGAVLAFATSFDELVISLLLQNSDVRPLPVVMFSSLSFNIDPTVAVASTFTMVITISAALTVVLARKATR
ncbi:ABC transporter permease [Streptomyces sp. NBC_00233]|uniref:ABC transporter permease n=1 Tax=Streptomyces sp. NBC_00233 TaxID=2975686 RepID=UPI00224FEA2C|nr:ABC transporter permease [Streptomyces sp. NBC_00233]MCX5233294.1 ABC transporter permease [Streptomyces sp. NBC_00233]